MKIKSICYYYPPLNSSEGYSAYKMYKYSQFHIEVISQKEFTAWTYSKDELLPENTIYIKSTDAHSWCKNVEKLNWKDTDILITRSMPTSSHVAGLKIKKENPKIKWIAFFSDPFSNSPLTKCEIIESLKKNLKKIKFINCIKIILHWLLGWIIQSINENLIYKNCDYIICNNKYQSDFMIRKKYSHKIKVLPHTYDHNDFYENIDHVSNEKITFMFAGSITNARNLDNFLKAFKKIKNDSTYRDKIDLHIISSDEHQVFKFLSNDDVSIFKNLSYNECLEHLAKADWLINADASCIQKYIKNYIYLPCKLIDYLSINNNVLNISNFEKSPSVDMVLNCNAINIKDDEQKIYNFIINVINNNLIKTKPSTFIKNFDNSIVVKELDVLISDLLKQKKTN